MNKQRLKTTVALVVLIAGLAVLAVLLLGRGPSTYMGVDELAARKAELVGTGIRLAGFAAATAIGGMLLAAVLRHIRRTDQRRQEQV